MPDGIWLIFNEKEGEAQSDVCRIRTLPGPASERSNGALYLFQVRRGIFSEIVPYQIEEFRVCPFVMRASARLRRPTD
jgi:hypothetical protein